MGSGKIMEVIKIENSQSEAIVNLLGESSAGNQQQGSVEESTAIGVMQADGSQKHGEVFDFIDEQTVLLDVVLYV